MRAARMIWDFIGSEIECRPGCRHSGPNRKWKCTRENLSFLCRWYSRTKRIVIFGAFRFLVFEIASLNAATVNLVTMSIMSRPAVKLVPKIEATAIHFRGSFTYSPDSPDSPPPNCSSGVDLHKGVSELPPYLSVPVQFSSDLDFQNPPSAPTSQQLLLPSTERIGGGPAAGPTLMLGHPQQAMPARRPRHH